MNKIRFVYVGLSNDVVTWLRYVALTDIKKRITALYGSSDFQLTDYEGQEVLPAIIIAPKIPPHPSVETYGYYDPTSQIGFTRSLITVNPLQIPADPISAFQTYTLIEALAHETVHALGLLCHDSKGNPSLCSGVI